MAKRLVTVGDLVLDLLLDARLPVLADQHQTAQTFRFEAGGACTTILAARQLGLQVSALGTVGDDLQGKLLLDILQAATVDTSALLIPPGSSSTTVLALTDTAKGEHVFLGNYGLGPPIELSERARALLAAADAIFIPGYTLVEERLDGLVTAVFEWLAQSDSRLYLDVGPFFCQLPQERVNEVLTRTDLLLLTEAEVPFVSGETGDSRPLAACRRLRQQYPALTIVLKLAAAGCHILAHAVDLPCAGFSVDVRDTVGAGDAFAAAFIWADLNGYSLAECGTISNAMGAASVRKLGAGSNVPTATELQFLLDRDATGIKIIC